MKTAFSARHQSGFGWVFNLCHGIGFSMLVLIDSPAVCCSLVEVDVDVQRWQQCLK